MSASATAFAKPIYSGNITRYALLEFASACAFPVGNWLFFWLRIMTYGQVGVVDALAFAFGMFMEIPTGAIGDMIGKKYTLVCAMLFNGAGWLVMGFSDTLESLLVGFLIAQVGWAFYSGTSEALAYDSLKADGRENEFDRLYSRVGVGVVAILIASSLIGGVLYNLNERLPHLAWGAVFLLGTVFALGLKEPHIEHSTPRAAFSFKGYVAQLSAGFRHLITPALKPIVVPIMIVRGSLYMFQSGLILPILGLQFGFEADEQAVVAAFLLLGASVGTGLAPRLRRVLGDNRSLFLGGLLIGLGYFSGVFSLGVFGALTMFFIRLGGGAFNVVSSTLLNRAIPSQDRATTLSTVAVFVRIPYVLSAIVAGTMAENGQFALFCGVVAVMTLLASLPFLRKQSSVSFVTE